MPKFRAILALAALLPAAAQAKNYVLSRHTGVVGLVQLGDSERLVLSRAPKEFKRVEVPAGTPLAKMRFSRALFFPEIGVRAYFRSERVELIEIQEPFQGEIQNTRIKVFKLAPSRPEKWDDVLLQELGSPPEARTSGGSFNSEALFYPWGDVAFNANGPNEIAVYRDRDIYSKYRIGNFGRKVQMFGDTP